MEKMKFSKFKMIELFCGIGGFKIAADSLGIHTIWANDLKKEACTVYRENFDSKILEEGDLKLYIDDIPDHEILTAGFPCQPFSSAGKKEGTRDPRGTLFELIVDVIEKKSPNYFILENVKRLLSMEQGDHFSTILSALSSLNYFIEWRVLNAKDFGLAQNRERVFIVGTKIDSNNFEFSSVHKLVKLANLEDISSGPKGILTMMPNTKSWKKLSKNSTKYPFWGIAFNGSYFSHQLEKFSEKKEQILLSNVLESSPSEEFDLTESTLNRLTKNEFVNKFIHGVEVISNQGGGARMGYTIFGVNGLSPTLTASTSRHYERYKIGEKYRRLTPIEYARLQGFPDFHCSIVSKQHQYSLIGNAVPPPMAGWVLSKILSKKSVIGTSEINQTELFYE